VEPVAGLLLIRRQLLFRERLQANTSLANSYHDYTAASSAPRLIVLVWEGDADLGNAVWREGRRRVRVFLVIHVDAGVVAIRSCGYRDTAVVGCCLGRGVIVQGELLSGNSSGSTNLADCVEGPDEQQGDENEDHERNEQVNHSG